MVTALVLCPLLLAGAAFVFPIDRWRPFIVTLGGLLHLGLTVAILTVASPTGDAVGAGDDWLVLDDLGRLVLGFVSVLFAVCSVYAPGYLRVRESRPNRVFSTNLLLLLSMMSLMILSHHLGLMWVALESATLCTAPLLYFNRNARSLEATWKYLLIGSVGIALALLGSFFLAYSAVEPGLHTTLLFDDLIRDADRLSLPWLRAAFVLLFVGYGTKMGLAPMHTWKPDAYGEAPGLVGALLAGGLTSCAFLAILRFYRIVDAAGEGAFARDIMLTIGLASMAVAGVFVARQRDYKRMLAYSSVEHMGILMFGIGLGHTAHLGTLLHLVNNGLTKGVLFLAAANIHRAYRSKSIDHVRGALRRLPLSGTMFLAGFFAVTGSPPFGPFVSEFALVRAAFGEGRYLAGGLFLLLLAVVFVGMGATVLHMVQGDPPEEPHPSPYRDTFLTGAPMVICLALVVMMGTWIPAPILTLVENAVRFLEVAK